MLKPNLLALFLLVLSTLGVHGVYAQYARPSLRQELQASDSAFAKTQVPPLHLRSALLGTPDAPNSANTPRLGIEPAHRALFCRFDDELDRKKIPLRMRLGTLEAVNQKEGKPGW